MSEMTSEVVPGWDQADRMRKALREAGVGITEMASYLSVNRNTVGNWINGHQRPSVQTLRLWALRTGVSFEWLRDGDASDWHADRMRAMSAKLEELTGLVRREGIEPPTRWLFASCRTVERARSLRLITDRQARRVLERSAAA